ncbi:MAG: cobalamin-independent methionine synthase II family protein [Deltaproteobacteria bacterium]|nr:cobalamin-independent methionine synthase II family protein [Deltaproteobacteria bacterium]
MPTLNGKDLGPLPTMGVGSYASPSWLLAARRVLRAGDAGPADMEEAIQDAIKIAVWDQEEAGLDILTDGEIRRQRFLWNVVEKLSGLKLIPAQRKLGVMSYDSAPRFETVERVSAPGGFGLVEEYTYVRTLTDKPLKVCCPGPLTICLPITPQGGYPGGDYMPLLYDLAELVNRELKQLVAAGATFIQVDEPSVAGRTPHLPVEEAVKLFNKTVEGVNAKIALHICFGNNQGRPAMKRTYKPLFPGILEAKAEQLALEYANREMAELELWSRYGGDRELAAGVVDVKSMYLETPEDVAERIRTVLQHIKPEKLYLTCDCGFSASSRGLARAKLQALVEGAKIVRKEVTGK